MPLALLITVSAVRPKNSRSLRNSADVETGSLAGKAFLKVESDCDFGVFCGTALPQISSGPRKYRSAAIMKIQLVHKAVSWAWNGYGLVTTEGGAT
jgi:hypothetical protein